MQLIKCHIVDKNLKKSHGEYIHLAREKALRLQNKGLVTIEGDVKTPDNKVRLSGKKKIITGSYISINRFSGKNKPKIAWIQDCSKVGGAELSNKYLVETGQNCGFDIVGITPGNFVYGVLQQADLFIINNMFEFTNDQIQLICRFLYEERKPYIKYDHDLRERYKRIPFARRLFNRSLYNVYISPLHKKLIEEKLGTHESKVLPLAIDTDYYRVNKLMKINRDMNKIFVPCYRKCGDNIDSYMRKNPGNEYKIIGKNLEKKSTQEMINLYSECGYMLHLPKEPWAGERIYFEAELCGCKPIVNDNVGHKSWSKKVDLRQAVYDFWKGVDFVT